MEDELKKLWNAANTHAAIIGGEYVDGSAEEPDMPDDPAEVIRVVAEYLAGSI